MYNNARKRLGVILILILFVIMAFELGCIGKAQTDYNLKYNFHVGDRLVYNCTYITSDTNYTGYITNNTNYTGPIRIEMLVTDFDGKNITSKMTSTKTTNGNTTESSYVTIMDVYGNLIRSDPKDKIIPEVQPELPNLLKYPEKETQEGKPWTIVFKNNINENPLLKDEFEGTGNYTFLGTKTISTKAGKFECIGIKSETNFVSNAKRDYSNTTINYTTVGNISGENWVDLNGGFSVKSNYIMDKTLTMDLSGLANNSGYQDVGIENVSINSPPIETHIINELESIQKG
ncbi:hypothetical protein RG963_14280 [Methanosarcina sp. Z-7115]|uniref:Uncharacterized protein n=1 Tax=Methanosarcina baikalica TaxID=3073890 RepID=A0ABU2D4N5_9EURY|nr:hypothetical protein [Methanosarcina sp. Z-7115]MDR7666925.1 hypothetical protein [Methanosarcina sp. Z-7115]